MTGANPDALLYDKFSDKVFVYKGRSSNAAVIDPKTNSVLATIPLREIYRTINRKKRISHLGMSKNKCSG
jgi:YVTN family beta-propeller protein